MSIGSIFSIGAAITSLVGILGFVVACVTFIYAKNLAWKRKEFEGLQPPDRLQAVDQLAALYGLSFANSKNESEKFKLVTRYMRSKEVSNRLFATLGSVVFLACFAMIAFLPSKSGPKEARPLPSSPSPPSSGTADETVVAYKKQILELRTVMETTDPGWATKVRQDGARLAHWMELIDERQLHPAKVILKHEYRGWALLMLADTYNNYTRQRQKDSAQAEYAEAAIQEFDQAIGAMEKISQEARAGNADSAELYRWITGKSEDQNRTHYLRAAAIAVDVLSGNRYTRADLDTELGRIEASYLATIPAKQHPAMAVVLGIP